MKKVFLAVLFGLLLVGVISSCTGDNIAEENELYGIDNEEVKDGDI